MNVKEDKYKPVDYGVKVDDSLNTLSESNEGGFLKILQLYTRPGDVIADPTYGNGTFWRFVDRSQYDVKLTDLKTDGVDLRNMPYSEESIDMVVNDPPYRYTPDKNKKHEDTIGHGKVDELYNLQGAKLINTNAVFELYFDGMKEAKRVLKQGGFLVVKCQDTVEAGKNVWFHVTLIKKGEELGFACRDMLIVTPPSVLKTRWDRQRHLRKAHSYFLVFRKGGHFPFGMPSVCKR
jgi:DNA modification methylase